MRTLALFAVLVALALPVAVHAQSPAPIFDYQQLAPDVWAAVLRAKGPYAITNSLIVVSDDGVLVVDTQQSKPAVDEVIAKIKSITNRPVRWVVNTHEHLDHVGGNDAYLQAFGSQVAIIGHADQRTSVDVRTRASLAIEIESRTESLQEQRSQFERIKENPLLPPAIAAQMVRVMDDVGAYVEDLKHLELRPPTDMFTTTRVLRVGTREVHLIHPGPAHTRGDVAVWIPSLGLLAAGDLVEDGLSLVGETSTPAGWASALDSLSRMDVKILLPAHGAVQDRKLLDRQKSLFGDVVREVRRARQEGLTLEVAWNRIAAVAEAAITSASGDVPLPPGSLMNWLEACVAKAWNEAGE